VEALAPAAPSADRAQAARLFLRRALAVHTVDEVAQELAQTLQTTLGAPRTVLIVSDQVGELRLIGAHAGARLDSPEEAFERLGVRTRPLRRMDLEAADGALRALMDHLGGEIVLPLRHRGALIAVGVVAAPHMAVGEQELEFLRRVSHEASIAIANAHLYVERQGKAVARQQVTLATAMQEALVPDERPVRRGQIVLRGMFRPAAECGGDFWTWEDLGAGRMLVATGDVTGKGVAAAMLAATAKGVASAMRAARGTQLDPAEFLRALNGAIWRAARTRWLMTCFAIVIDCDRGELVCANAGHNFAYVVGGPDGLHQIVVRGNALGSAATAQFVSETRQLGPGESVLLYTDGIIDVTSPAGEQFSEKRLRRLLERQRQARAGSLPDVILAEIEGHAGGGRMPDDITMVEITRIIDSSHVELKPEVE
jgi:serine phosphatase RsbU (regulator of sigma subunit)